MGDAYVKEVTIYSKYTLYLAEKALKLLKQQSCMGELIPAIKRIHEHLILRISTAAKV